MENNKHSIYLKKLKEVHFKNLKDNKKYFEFCKTNKDLSPKNYKIKSNHKLDEYFSKYGKKLKNGKLLAFKENELWLMNKKTTYWEIKNKSDFIYFEAPTNLKPLWISLTSLFVAGAVAGGITVGVLFSKGNFGGGGSSEIHTLKFNIENLKIEGVKNGHQFHSGDNITFDVKKAEGLSEMYVLPSKNEIAYTNFDSEDVTYTTGDNKITLSFIAPDNDVNISMMANTALWFRADQEDAVTNESNTVGYEYSDLDSGNSTIKFDIQKSFNGVDWSSWDGTDIDLDGDTPNGILYVKNNSNILSEEIFEGKDPTHGYYFYFTMSGAIEAGGNVNSMINYSALTDTCYDSLFIDCDALVHLDDSFRLPATDLTHHCYSYLFCGTKITHIPDNFTLPATTLADYCYTCMFFDSYIETLPDNFILPASTLAEGCYSYMFADTFIETLPDNFTLPATTLADYCYAYMFYNSSLDVLPDNFTLPAITLADYCYAYMFYNSSLDDLPDNFILPASTLAEGCYSYMFADTYIDTLPDNFTLPATTLADYCYAYMFYNSFLNALPDNFTLRAITLADYCYTYMFADSSLDALPDNFILPATTLAEGCYSYMFYSCSYLISAPTIIAETLANYCCDEMFKDCSKLNVSINSSGTRIFKCPADVDNYTNAVYDMFADTFNSGIIVAANQTYYYA